MTCDAAMDSERIPTVHSVEQFASLVRDLVSDFPRNAICKRVDEGSLCMSDYHSLLLMIFHQVKESSGSFALAAAQLSERDEAARDYLLRHAAEEHTHWRWILDDLAATGYSGPSPRDLLPPVSCQSYIAFNYFVALKHPIARLAIAAVLESIGGTHGKRYAAQTCRVLGLGRSQASFYFGHGDTDAVHSQEIFEVLSEQCLTESDWVWMSHAARTAADLYTRMYDEALG